VSIARSLLYGFGNLLHPRMLWLMLWPMLVSLLVWGTVAIVLWVRTAVWLAGVLQQLLQSVPLVASLDLAAFALIAAHVLLFLAFVPLVYLTALFILSMFGMEKMVDHVADRTYPDLERRRGGGFSGSVTNGVVSLLGMAGLAIASVPLWLVPPLWPVIPVVILGWANQRLLRYDALAEHATAEERSALFRQLRGRLYLLGVLFALAAYVPVLGLLSPVVFGLAFIHYLLGALRERRVAGAVTPSLERKP
jgi:CysZ protein